MLNIDNKTYRNLPEQVAANLENILKIKSYLDTHPRANIFSTSDSFTNIETLYSQSNIIKPEEPEYTVKEGDIILFANGYYATVTELYNESVYNVVDPFYLKGETGPQGPTGLGITDVSLNENNAFVITLENGTTITTDTMSASRLYRHTIYLYTTDGNNNYYRCWFTIIDDYKNAYGSIGTIYNKYKMPEVNDTCFFEAGGTIYDSTFNTPKAISALRFSNPTTNHVVVEGVDNEKGQAILEDVVNGNAYDEVVPLTLAVAKGDTGPQGETGPQGPTGATGPQGPTGATGNGIASISLYSESGLDRTYRIMFTDGSHFDFTVTNGSSFVNVDGQDIAPRNVGATGNITAPSIIETMTGYSFIPKTGAITTLYAGACKNGNKLTFVLFIKYRGNLNANTYSALGDFVIPQSIFDELQQTLIGATNVINMIPCVLQSGDGIGNTDNIEGIMYIRKSSPNKIYFSMYTKTNVTDVRDYFIRSEATFLLSENLAQ